LLLVAFTLLYTTLNWAIHTRVIMPGFLEVERNQAAKSVKRTVAALNREIAGLDSLCADWADWDDSFQFIDDHNPDFIRSNLVAETFSSNHLNLLLFYDLDGNYVAGNTFDPTTGTFFPFADFPLTKLPKRDSLFRQLPARPATTGIIATSRGPMLLSARVIRHSDNSGPANGLLLMGSFLDDRKIATLGRQTVQNLEIIPVPRLSPPEREIFSRLTPANDFFHLEADQQEMHAYTSFADLEGAPFLLIKVDLSRNIYDHGHQTMQLSLALTVIAGFLVMLPLLYLTHAKIVRPIEMLQEQIATIRRQGALQPFKVKKGAVEIDTVVDEFNILISQLTAKGREQEITRRERETLIGELQTALSKVKQLKGLLPICASCKKIRDDSGYWNQIETYIRNHSEANFTHSICESCAKKLYPEMYDTKETV
jgi:sensor domain CHASE-containing protein